MDMQHGQDAEAGQRAMIAPPGGARHSQSRDLQRDLDRDSCSAAHTRSHKTSGADALTRAVETEIVPRLVLSHRASQRPRPAPNALYQPSMADAAELARLVAHEEAAAEDFITCVHERGATMESIYIDLLGGAARTLGMQWEEDEVTFTHVTTGVWRLQQMLHRFRPLFQAESPARQTGKRIFLSPMIGEQHSFGLMLLSEFFRRDGWDVQNTVASSVAELIDIVRGEWFDIVGFSVGNGERLDNLRAAIKAARRASRNLQVGIMVGGPVFSLNPDLVGQVGADVTAPDARTAVRLAEQTLTLLARQR
jgi:methanogenic corrinoid protein MtbC1